MKKSMLYVRMASTSSSTPHTFASHRIRTIALAAHIDAGKTTTTERLLWCGGVIPKPGEVDTGRTTTDFLPDEQERGITIQSAVASLPWKDHQLHLVDTPGHADFVVEVERSLRVVDGAVLLLDGTAGVQARSYSVWQQCAQYQIPFLVFINKMDLPHANFSAACQSLSQKLHVEPLIIQLPWGGEDGGDGQLEGVIDVISQEVLTFEGTTVNRRPLDSGSEKKVAQAARARLIHQLTAVDDVLTERLITELDKADGEESQAEAGLTAEDLTASVRRVVVNPPAASSNGSTRAGRPRRLFVPVLCGAARRDCGIPPLLDAIIKYLPSPCERSLSGVDSKGVAVTLPPLTTSFRRFSKPASAGAAGAQSELLAYAFKVMHTVNPMNGKREPLVLLRVFRGELVPSVRPMLWNRNRNREERVRRVYRLQGGGPLVEVARLGVGDLGGVFLSHTFSGDTLSGSPTTSTSAASSTQGGAANSAKSQGEAGGKEGVEDDERLHLLEGLDVQTPVLGFVVEPSTLAEEERLKHALAEMTREDPTLVLTKSTDSGQTILKGLGELHLEVALSRLRREYHVGCRLLKPLIDYREGIIGVGMEENAGWAGPVYYQEANVAEVSIQLLSPSTLPGFSTPLIPADAACACVLEASAVEIPAANSNSSTAREATHRESWHRALAIAFQEALEDVARAGPLTAAPLHGLQARVHRYLPRSAASIPPPHVLKATAQAALTGTIQHYHRLKGGYLQLLEPVMLAHIELSDVSFASEVMQCLFQRQPLWVENRGERESEEGCHQTIVIEAGLLVSRMTRLSAQLRQVTKGHATLFVSLLGYQAAAGGTQPQT